MSRWNLAWLLGITAVVLVGLSLSHSAPTGRQAITLKEKHENLRLLVDVLEEVQQKYVKDLDAGKMRELVENMVNSGLEQLDPHSGFINADEFRQFKNQSKGKFGGIGIRIGFERGQVFVESPMVGTPAYEAGVQAGDLILKVDGQSTENMPLKKVVEMIQGDPGDAVTLTVLHEGEKQPVDLKIVRAEIVVDSVLGDQRSPDNLKEWDYWVDRVTKIAYVRITTFSETTFVELSKVIEQLQQQKMRGLIVDLRNNPGGLLRAAVQVSSLFLPDGKRVVSTKGRQNQSEEVYTARRETPKIQPTGFPIAVLVNRYSASASEILAAALQDHFRAVIIGERSYGKGSVQNIIPLEAGASALKLTTQSYWRPSGKNIHRFPDSKEQDDWGVKPNPGYEVKLTDEERIDYFRWRRDRDIVRRGGAENKQPAKEEKKKEFKDRVLDKAIEYIRAELKKETQQGAAPLMPQIQPPAAVLPGLNLNAGRVEEERNVAAVTRAALGHRSRRQV